MQSTEQPQKTSLEGLLPSTALGDAERTAPKESPTVYPSFDSAADESKKKGGMGGCFGFLLLAVICLGLFFAHSKGYFGGSSRLRVDDANETTTPDTENDASGTVDETMPPLAPNEPRPSAVTAPATPDGQIAAVAKLQVTLRDYRATNGQFPETLADLHATVPNDAYTGKPFPYETSGLAYSLKFEIRKPKDATAQKKYAKFAEGSNTATADAASVEAGNCIGASGYVTPLVEPGAKKAAITEDSDGDGLSDTFEYFTIKSDPHVRDTDGDGLLDFDEYYQYKTSPLRADTDGDGYNDGQEVHSGHDPNLNDKTCLRYQ